MSKAVGDEESDQLIFKPLGAGQEVGRSCHLLQFKGKRILLDCGIHPGMSGLDALPFVDLIDCEKIDVLLITHFHLDHAGALPWFLEKTSFRGRCFMTHATKSIYRMLLGDYIKVSQYGSDRVLFNEEDLERSMDKIEVIDFHEQKEVNGVRFWCYVAGHVLGAAMFMIEIAGVKVLYTGDFSRLEDRHLCAAEIPNIRPDVLVVCSSCCWPWEEVNPLEESTYGTQIHEKREDRERRFTSLVHDIVGRGGRCIIPVFALGRAQELLLILDEYWEQHPELQEIPIYYASSLAKKCMAVYQTFVSGMNRKIQSQIAAHNPFIFKHISNLKSIDHFEDVGPCVVLASPGMMQSGLSRELFEGWCPDPKNGCIIAGYCVEGTLAKHVLSEPEEVMSLSGQKLAMRLQVAYISFSAHTDYRQTSEFIRLLKPPHVILVHGEKNEMSRLKAAIVREYEDDADFHIDVYNPANTEEVLLEFSGEKTAKVVGKLAQVPPKDGDVLSGVLVRRNFNYHLMHPDDLSAYTELSHSVLTQKQSVFYSGSLPLLQYYLHQIAGDVEVSDPDPSAPVDSKAPVQKVLRAFNRVVLLKWQPPVVVVEWAANPVNDMLADAALAAVLQAEAKPIPAKSIPDTKPFTLGRLRAALLETLADLFGDAAVISPADAKAKPDEPLPPGMEAMETARSLPPTTSKEDGAAVEDIRLEIDDKAARINLNTLEVECEDKALAELISTAVNKLHQCLAPTVKASS